GTATDRGSIAYHDALAGYDVSLPGSARELSNVAVLDSAIDIEPAPPAQMADRPITATTLESGETVNPFSILIDDDRGPAARDAADHPPKADPSAPGAATESASAQTGDDETGARRWVPLDMTRDLPEEATAATGSLHFDIGGVPDGAVLNPPAMAAGVAAVAMGNGVWRLRGTNSGPRADTAVDVLEDVWIGLPPDFVGRLELAVAGFAGSASEPFARFDFDQDIDLVGDAGLGAAESDDDRWIAVDTAPIRAALGDHAGTPGTAIVVRAIDAPAGCRLRLGDGPVISADEAGDWRIDEHDLAHLSGLSIKVPEHWNSEFDLQVGTGAGADPAEPVILTVNRVTTEAPEDIVATDTTFVIAAEALNLDHRLVDVAPIDERILSGESVPAAGHNGVDLRNLTLAYEQLVQVSWEVGDGGFGDTIGWYRIGPEGEISDVRIIRQSSDLPRAPSTESLVESRSLGTLPAGTRIGFFVLADVADIGTPRHVSHLDLEAGTLMFHRKGTGTGVGQAPGVPATIHDRAGEIDLVFVVDGKVARVLAGNPFRSADPGKIYHTAASINPALNADGVEHAASGLRTVMRDETRRDELVIAFQDLFLEDDNDEHFSRTVLCVGFTPAAGQLAQYFTLADLEITDVDSDALEEAVVAVTGFQDGDVLTLDNRALDNGAIGEMIGDIQVQNYVRSQSQRTVVLTLVGTAPRDAYRALLRSVGLAGRVVAAGTRSLVITVTDDDGAPGMPQEINVSAPEGPGRATATD
ncbi:MAG: hypothetical protein QF926_06935, partial [Alphaproteobacteria bacterium]|nr:hypothetical protein [Alphaproteobacteria bacterium]